MHIFMNTLGKGSIVTHPVCLRLVNVGTFLATYILVIIVDVVLDRRIRQSQKNSEQKYELALASSRVSSGRMSTLPIGREIRTPPWQRIHDVTHSDNGANVTS